MLNKTAYRVGQVAGSDIPIIERTDYTDIDGMSWRDAKKQLRQWYLNEAANLRKISEKDYFGTEEIPF